MDKTTDQYGISKKDLPYIALFVLLAHAFFWKFLVPGQMVFGTDTLTQSYPIQVMGMREIFRNGAVPLWNPYIYSGMPLLASFSFHIFYPGSWLYFFMPTEFVMGYQYILHCFLMGIFFYFFMRGIGLSREASFVGGLLFMFNAHFISLIYPGHGGKLFTITWLPLALLALDRALKERTFYYSSLLGLCIGMMFYGGHIQILFYCGIVLFLFLLTGIAAMYRDKGPKWALRTSAGFVYAFAAGTLLYAAILIPAWQYKGYTERGGGALTKASSYEFATSFSEPPEDLSYIFLRNPFGWGKDYGPEQPNTKDEFYRGRIGLRLSIDYFSVIGLALAAIGVLLVRNRYTWFFFGMALLSAFLSLGMFNPFYQYIYKYVPGFSIFRVPYAIMILIPLCGSVNAAFGFQKLLDWKRESGEKWPKYFASALAGLGIIVGCVALVAKSHPDAFLNVFLSWRWVQEMLWYDTSDVYQRFAFLANNLLYFSIFLYAAAGLIFVYSLGLLKPKVMLAATALLMLVDLWPAGWDFVKTIPLSQIPGKYFKETQCIKTIRADKDPSFRVFTAAHNNELLYYGIQTVAGYHAAPLEYYQKVIDNISFESSILDLLNAKYLVFPKKPEYDFRSVADASSRDWLLKKYEPIDDPDYYFYKNKNAMPRAWLVNKLFFVDAQQEALGIICDPQFVPGQAAILADKLNANIAPNADLSSQRMEMADYRPDSMTMKVHAPADSFMVLSEVWYPGWQAKVDGKDTSIFRTDYAFRGILMPAGDHIVTMEFKPWNYRAGIAATSGTLAFLLAVAFWPAARRYRERRNARN
jgi:hypothetical protein